MSWKSFFGWIENSPEIEMKLIKIINKNLKCFEFEIGLKISGGVRLSVKLQWSSDIKEFVWFTEKYCKGSWRTYVLHS